MFLKESSRSKIDDSLRETFCFGSFTVGIATLNRQLNRDYPLTGKGLSDVTAWHGLRASFHSPLQRFVNQKIEFSVFRFQRVEIQMDRGAEVTYLFFCRQGDEVVTS